MRRKRFLSVFICLALAFTLLPMVATAGSIAIISDRDDLAAISSNGNYLLIADTNGAPKTTTEMKTADPFTDWDFGGVWKLKSDSYPSFLAISAVTVTGGTGSGEYSEGGTVTITANAPETGKRFKEWTISPAVTFADGTSAADSTATFIMPAGDVTVTATYENSYAVLQHQRQAVQ